jgi:hypothetical protein
MTLSDLIVAASREPHDATLTLRQVAEVTGMSVETIRSWVYRRKCLPAVHVGPTQRARVLRSVVIRMWCPHSSVPAPSRVSSGKTDIK